MASPKVVARVHRHADEDHPHFKASIDRHGRPVLIGELDGSGITALRVVLDQAFLDANEDIVIDVSKLAFIDSTAVGELLRYQVAAAATRRRIWLDLPTSTVCQIIDALDLRHLLLEPAEEARGVSTPLGEAAS